jgi:hypothetical protein
MISLIQNEQIRELIFKTLDFHLRNLNFILSECAYEYRQIYNLVTSERLSAFFRSEKAINKVPNEIKAAKSYKRVYGKRSPLIIACENNNIELVQFLITRGEYINVQDVDGKTALMKACISGYFELAQMLLSLGADVQIEDENEENAAFFIKSRKEITKTDWAFRVFTRLLNTKKIDINKPHKFGKTLLFYACSNEQQSIVEFLFENEVNKKISTRFIQGTISYEVVL